MMENILNTLLTDSERALCAVLPSSGDASRRAARSFALDEFDDNAAPTAAGNERMELRIELGRTRLRPDEAHKLRGGSVVTLDKLTDEPVGVFVDRRRIGRGELMVLDGKIAVRLVEVTR